MQAAENVERWGLSSGWPAFSCWFSRCFKFWLLGDFKQLHHSLITDPIWTMLSDGDRNLYLLESAPSF
jgi:hypothetical protein